MARNQSFTGSLDESPSVFLAQESFFLWNPNVRVQGTVLHPISAFSTDGVFALPDGYSTQCVHGSESYSD